MVYTVGMVSRDTVVVRILQVLAVWGVIASGIPVTFFFLTADQQDPDQFAIVCMGMGLLIIWCVIGGILMRLGRDRFVSAAKRMRVGWRARFVLLCILMAMLEEVVTTSLSNAAPLFGAATDAAKITISTNYFEVISTSVIAFVPWFIFWGWFLGKYDFRPLEVFLLIGLTGTIAESTIDFRWGNFAGVGMWTYVYGLMVYLPAHTVPRDRPVKPARWYHFIAAVFVPLVFIIPLLIYLVYWILRKALRVVLGLF